MEGDVRGPIPWEIAGSFSHVVFFPELARPVELIQQHAEASAFDTWAIGTGLEVGGPETGVSRFPLRLGYRYATLPVSPTGEQPTEASFSAGVGASLAGGRGLVDLAVERVYRNGAGARETAWQLSWMVTVRP